MFGLRAPLREFNIPLTPFKGIAVKLRSLRKDLQGG